jgi:hypothetical protein
MKVVRSHGTCRVLYLGRFHDATYVLAPTGIDVPACSTWHEIVLRQWETVVGDPAPSIIVGRPSCGRILPAIEATIAGCHANH